MSDWKRILRAFNTPGSSHTGVRLEEAASGTRTVWHGLLAVLRVWLMC